jgi:N-acetylglucosamine-6-phosphate deacetylase
MAVDAGGASFKGRDVATGQPVVVIIDDGVIASAGPLDERESDDLPWIAPGLADLQVNGFAGIDLNGPNPSPEQVARLTRALLRVGVTSYLPTVVTGMPEEIEARLNAVSASIRADRLTAACVAGIHLEGPFISPEDGARGAHLLSAVRPPDWTLFERWQAAAEGRIRIVTLSPECPDAPAFIARCRESGVIPAIGHTAATPEQIRDAVDAGALLSTHFGNGVHPILPRHPNYLWEQLAADELWASVIADGFHLPDAVLKTVMRMKGSKAILVSDSVALAGMPPGEYESAIGSRVVLTPEGRLHLAADPRLLAGSAQPLLAGIAHLVRSGLATLGEAWAMASTRPLTLLSHPGAAGLETGEPADLVLFHWNEDVIDIEEVVKAGKTVVGGIER